MMSSIPSLPVLLALLLGLVRSPLPMCDGFDCDYLMMVEPNPVKPPLYHSLPPGGTPRFNVMDDISMGTEALPLYAPLVYKVASVSRKLEWLLPYEPATLRAWRQVVIELNLTQLNVYAIPTHLEAAIQLMATDTPHCTYSPHEVSLALTRPRDLLMHRHCTGLGIFDLRRLIRLYSLQHAKVGLASDYKKKVNVLRVRIELEQLLFGFNGVEELIEWHTALGVGRDLALDLSEREMPKYRTVPRRRRRRRLSLTESTTRARSQSDPTAIFRRIKKKFSLTNLQMLAAAIERLPPPLMPPLAPRLRSLLGAPPPSFDDDEEQEDVEMADLGADDDDEDELEPEVRPRLKLLPRVRALLPLAKWNPGTEQLLTYRHYKTCLRCIKPLAYEDSWVGRSLVKSAPAPRESLSLRLSYTSLADMAGDDYKLEPYSPHTYLHEFIVAPQGLVPRVY